MKRTFGMLLLGCIVWATPALADPGRGATVLCYVWANDASPTPNVPYTPSSFYSFNTQDRATGNSVTKHSTGVYSVTCTGVGGDRAWGEGGHVQVSSYGDGNNVSCHVGSWSTGGPDFTASVNCFGSGGGTGGGPQPRDSQFVLLFVW